MKTTLIIGIMTLFIVSCSSNEQSPEVTELSFTSDQVGQNDVDEVKQIAKNLSADEFKDKLQHDPGTLLDVRTPEEFAEGAIEGALNIDYYASDFQIQLKTLDKKVPVYVYCRSGGRSKRALDMMVEMGFHEIYALIGGYSSWPY